VSESNAKPHAVLSHSLPVSWAVALLMASCAAPASKGPPAPPAAAPSRVASTVAAPPATPTAEAQPSAAASRPSPQAGAASSASATFLAVGDVLLSRRVAGCIVDRGDLNAPFRDIAPVLGGVDFTFGNLESPFSESSAFSRSAANIFNAPPAHVAGLVQHRFRVVSLANNHALDQGVPGLRFTLSHLATNDIATVGAGLDMEQAWKPAIVTIRGIRIGFVGASYASVNDDGSTQNRYVARLEDHRRLRAAMEKLDAEADVVVVTMHAGSEYNPTVHSSQVAFARLAIDLGADVVIGAHPHVLQRLERYRGRYIFYSLGNFIFDHVRPGTRDGLAVRTTVGLIPSPPGQRRGAVTGLELLPVVIEGRCSPRPATEQEAERILAAVRAPGPVLAVQPRVTLVRHGSEGVRTGAPAAPAE